jgi:hypothetical protein
MLTFYNAFVVCKLLLWEVMTSDEFAKGSDEQIKDAGETHPG